MPFFRLHCGLHADIIPGGPAGSTGSAPIGSLGGVNTSGVPAAPIVPADPVLVDGATPNLKKIAELRRNHLERNDPATGLTSSAPNGSATPAPPPEAEGHGMSIQSFAPCDQS